MKISGMSLRALLAAVVFTFGVACGEEAPKEKPKSLAEKNAEKEAGKGDAKKTDAPAASKPKATDPALNLPVQKVEPVAAEQKGPSEVSKALGTVAVYGVTGPLEALREKALGTLPGDIADNAKKELEKALGEGISEIGLRNMDFLDTTRGIGFAVQGKDQVVVAWPLKGELALLKAALPEGTTPDEHGGYKVKEEYVLPQGNLLLQAKSFEVIDGLSGEMKLELGRMNTQNLLVVVVDGASLKALVASGLEDFEREITAQGVMPADQRDFIIKMLNFVKGFVADVAKVTFTMGTQEADLTLQIEVNAVEGSGMAKTFATLTGGTFEMSKYLPPDSWLVGASWFPTSLLGDFVEGYSELMGAAWKLSDADKLALKKQYSELLTLMGPESAMAVYHEDGFPLSFTTVNSTSDGLKMRDKMFEFYDFLYKKAISALPPQQRGMLEGRGFKDLVQGMLAPMLAQQGILIKMDTEDYQGGKVDYLVFEINWDGIPLPPEASWVKNVLRKSLGFAVATAGDRVAMTFGPNPIVRAKMVVDGVGGLNIGAAVGEETIKAGAMMVMALQMPVLMDSLFSIPEIQTASAEMPWLQGLRKVRGLQISALGAATGSLTINMKLDAKNLVEAMAPLIREEMGMVPAAEGAAGTDAPAPAPAPEAAPAPAPAPEAAPSAPAAEAAPAAPAAQ